MNHLRLAPVLLVLLLALTACAAPAASRTPETPNAPETTEAPSEPLPAGEPTLEELCGADYQTYLTETITMQMENRMEKNPEVHY